MTGTKANPPDGFARRHGYRRSAFRRAGALRVLALSGAALALAGCGPSGFTGPRGDLLSSPAPTAPTPAAPAAASGETIGQGPTRIALIAPLTRAGEKTGLGASVRNAVEMAVSEHGANDVTVLVKDDQSTPEGARRAAQAAVAEGAQLVLGPVFAGAVREAGAVARAANRPLIGYSTDATAASRGVFLLSFLPESDIDRIVDYAAASGKKSIAALIPENDYGNLAAAAFQTAAARDGLRVMAVERYKPGAGKTAAANVGALGAQIDALFIAEQPDAVAALGRDLQAAGVSPAKVQILGTSLWSDARAYSQPILQGAWFASPENAGFNAFAARYRAKYGSDPARIASLAFDSATLAIALAKSQGAGAFSEATLTNASGFNGADGVFRFRADGLNERGLSVLKISGGRASVVSPAPRSFSTPPS